MVRGLAQNIKDILAASLIFLIGRKEWIKWENGNGGVKSGGSWYDAIVVSGVR